MNFTPQQKAWILLVSLIIGTGTGAAVLAYTGGAKLWVSIAIGMGTAGTNVYHALSKSPNDSTDNKS